MTSSSFDSTGAARRALEEIYRDYGLQGIDNEALLNQLLPDLLAGSPKETGLLKSAASTKTGEQLLTRINGGLAPAVAVRDVAAILGQSYALDPNACLWVVGEYAAALGHPVDVVAFQTASPAAQQPPAPPTAAPQPPTFDPTKVDQAPPPAPPRPEQVFLPGRAALPTPPPPPVPAPTMVAGYDATMADRGIHPGNPPVVPMPPQISYPPVSGGPMPPQISYPPVSGGPMPHMGPAPAKRSSVLPLVLGSVAVVLVLIVVGIVGVVLVLKEKDTTCIGADCSAASSSTPSPRSSESPSPQPSASRSPESTLVDTVDLLPNDLSVARDCEVYGDSTPDGLVGLTDQYNCVYAAGSTLAGAEVNLYRFDSLRSLEQSLTGFNTEREIDDLDAECPPKGDSVGGTFEWHQTSTPTVGGTLECYISVGEKQFYVWTEETNFVMYEVSTDKSFAVLDDWWRHMDRDAD